ncbi:TonB-dependent receptor [Arsukibacterium indicum]|uniref:TonB-dependent receptor n=1 Tax=Arsukibacterium indicum TaxID=2848612 RepID=A0ABS6MIX7_9GAMM|nr:TonB-dependent receptor [Arsukibacterium indicum]MBV2128565.1 TonB-dependent receptor [Arsukibacterium indicum]
MSELLSENNKCGIKKARLSLAISAALLGISPMWLAAQTLPENDSGVIAQKNAEAVEVIEVKGIRGSMQSAQDLKRYADTVKDVVTATDIGALPDKSVTEALQRLPGVTIERFASSDDPKHYADEGTSVLVRGLDRVRSEINGRDSFSANPYGGLSYEDFPAELLSAVEVVKNQTADLISGGISGTVNLITRKPFDSDERMFAVSAQANYGDYRKEATPSFSALFSDNWDTDSGKFGLLVAVSDSELRTRGDGFGLGNYHSRGPVDTFSYDEWGTPSPGIVAGLYSNPCIPGAADWRACGPGFEDTVQYTQEDQAAYVPEFEGQALEGQPDGVTWYAPASYTMTTAENDRKRQGLTAALQWQSADEKITMTLEHINSDASLTWREYVIASGDRGFLPYAPNAIQWFDEGDQGRPLTVDNNGYLTSGVGRSNEPELPLQFRSRYNYNESTVEDTSLNLVFKPTDILTVVVDYQHVDSEQIVHNNSVTSRINGNQTAQYAPFFLDLRGSSPTIEYLNENTSNPADVEPNTNPILRISNGMQQEEHNEANSDTLQLDVEYKLAGTFTKIQAGLYYSEKELTVRNTDYEGWQALGTPWNAQASYNASPQVVPELYDRIDFSDHNNGNTLVGPYDSFLFPQMNLAENYVQTLRDGCGSWIAQGTAMDGSGGCALPYEDLADRVFSHFAPRHISSSNTERTEFYVRGDFEIDKLDVYISGNVGLRYVNYKLQSTGGISLPATSRRGTDETGSLYQVMQNQYPSIFALASGESFASTIDGTDYTTVLPSLNLNFGITEDFIVRFGASKGLYYPSLVDAANKMVISLDYQEVYQNPDEGKDEATNPTVDLTNIEISANARNAFLEPEESVNLDLTAEWYFSQVGSLTLGLFHKRLSNIIRNKQFSTEVEVDGTSYPVSAYGPDNTGSGTIRGYELSYTQFYDMLPGMWSGLGMQFNYTYIDQNGLEDPNTNPTRPIQFNGAGVPISDNRNTFRQFTGLPLQGYSDQNVNIVGMYENDDFAFRLAYTWRSEYLLTLRESEEFVPAYSKAQGMMDASLFYTINDNIKVGLQVNNVLGTDTETQYQQNQEGTKTDAFTFTTDRRYALTVRAVF